VIAKGIKHKEKYFIGRYDLESLKIEEEIKDAEL
tara:strand:+ start:488 stop:589 length:102 start_codon:yes stop_codon:yes gene_type:complete